MPNEIPLVQYSTSVRVVSLLEGNESDISPKYRLLKEQGLQPEQQLPSALIIGLYNYFPVEQSKSKHKL